MRILVLGGTRFIGLPAIRRLVERGHEVTAFHRGQQKTSLPTEVQSLYGDRKHLADFGDAFRQLQPDVVLDMFAYTLDDAETLLATFEGIARRLVIISSADVYRARDRVTLDEPGEPDPAPLTENSPLRTRLFPYSPTRHTPKDPEYRTTYEKILVERTVMSAPDRLPTTILRLPMVYGPGDYQHRFYDYLKRMDDGRPAILLPEGIETWRAPRGYVEDMGEAIALCVVEDKAGGQIYHVADSTNLTESELISRIAQATHWQGKVVVLPNERLPEHLRVSINTGQEWSLDSSKIRRELGYSEIIAPEEAMRRTLEWERAHPPEAQVETSFDYTAEDLALAR